MKSDRIIRAAAVVMALLCLGMAAVLIYKICDTLEQDQESADAYESMLEQAVRHGEPGESPAPAVPETGNPILGESTGLFEGVFGGNGEMEHPVDGTLSEDAGDRQVGLEEVVSFLRGLAVRLERRESEDRNERNGSSLVSDSSGKDEVVPGERSTDSVELSSAEDQQSDMGRDIGGTAEDQDEGSQYDSCPEVGMEYLKSVNSDIVGWLYCPGTVINYPVVQGNDNSYYLTHLADGSENRNGCLFIDCDNSADLSDENTIIYGHHMQSGALFATLVKYADQAYYDAHPYLYLDVNGAKYRIEVFSGYNATVDDDAYCRTFSCDEDHVEWLERIALRSDFQADNFPAAGERIVTLSTCSYSFDNARYVLHGALVRLD